MIERIVLIKLNDEHAHDAGRAAVAARSREILSALPDVTAVAVGVPADEPSLKSWDLSLTLRFESLEAVEAYRVHPSHRAYVDEYLKPRLLLIKAWNFDI